MAAPTRPPPPQPPPPPLAHAAPPPAPAPAPASALPPHPHAAVHHPSAPGSNASVGAVYPPHAHAHAHPHPHAHPHHVAMLPPLQPLQQVAVPVPNYYELYIGAIEHSHRLQGALDAIRAENERLRDRVTALERVRPEQPKSQSRYWTPDEHQRFLEALQEYGPKDVRSIATYVGTRNATQVRTHAQKYWIRVQREEARRGGKHSLAAARRRCVSESDLAKVDRDTHTSPSSPAASSGASAGAAANHPAPASPPRQRFPLPKPGRSPLAKKALGVMDIVSATETSVPNPSTNVTAVSSSSLPPQAVSIPVSSALPPTQAPRPPQATSLPLPPPSMLSAAKPPRANARTDRDTEDCNSGIKLLSMVADREQQRVPMQQ